MGNHQVQNSPKNILIYYISTTADARLNHLMILAGFVRVLESPGILLWHFPRGKSLKKATGPGKFWKSVKLKYKNMKCMADSTEN